MSQRITRTFVDPYGSAAFPTSEWDVDTVNRVGGLLDTLLYVIEDNVGGYHNDPLYLAVYRAYEQFEKIWIEKEEADEAQAD